jgi:Protein of unknown function (DUF3631)
MSTARNHDDTADLISRINAVFLPADGEALVRTLVDRPAQPEYAERDAGVTTTPHAPDTFDDETTDQPLPSQEFREVAGSALAFEHLGGVVIAVDPTPGDAEALDVEPAEEAAAPDGPVLLRYDPMYGMIPADPVEDAAAIAALQAAAEEHAAELSELSEEALRRAIIDDTMAAGQAGQEARRNNLVAEQDRRAHERRVQQEATERANALRDYFGSYLVFPEKHRKHYLALLTVWSIHTYSFRRAGRTPYLAIIAPTRGSGKTTVEEVLSTVVSNPTGIEVNPTPAVVRLYADEGRTLLLDEIDELATDKSFTGLMNSGYKAGGTSTRVGRVGGGQGARKSSTFCPKVVAGIAAEGRLPLAAPTLDRCIDIRILRAKPGEITKRFRVDIMRDEAEVAALREWAATWSRVQYNEIRDAYFEVPLLSDTRAMEIWEPLITVAGLLGPEWYAAIVDAARALDAMGGQSVDKNIALVQDVHTIVDAYREVAPEATEIKADDLVSLRNGLTGRKLAEKLTTEQFTKRLGAFGIDAALDDVKGTPTLVYHVADENGDLYPDWEDLFSRYDA